MALWKQGDAQTEARRNREAFIGRLGLQVYDVAAGGAVTLTPVRVQTTLTTNPTPFYSVSSTPSTRKAIVHSLSAFNSGAVTRPVVFNLVPPALSAVDGNAIFKGSLLAGERMVLSAPKGLCFLAAGWTIVGDSDANGIVAVHLETSEYDDNPVGVRIVTVNPAALPTANTTLYTAPLTGISHATLLCVNIVNVSGGVAVPTVYRKPSADVVGDISQILIGESLDTGEIISDDTSHTLYPGDAIVAKGNIANACTIHLTIAEFE